MIAQQKLEDLIREKIPMAAPTALGFEGLKCACCQDYKERGAFKFEDGQIRYNCFNCGAAGNFQEYSGRISRRMRGILNAFGIEDSEISAVINTAFFNKRESDAPAITLASLTKVNTATPEIKFPENTFQLGQSDEHLEMQIRLATYLHDRKIDMTAYDFYFSTEERFKDRVIIPFYRNGKLIFWQARSIIGSEKKRYDNAIISREAVMFNMDQLNVRNDSILFVTEGVFDAMPVNGVALLGSKLTEAKIQLLSKSTRKIVCVIDKDDNGRKFAEKVVELGWSITFAPNGAEDINKSVQRFGLIWTVNELMKSIRTGRDSSQLLINLNCK